MITSYRVLTARGRSADKVDALIEAQAMSERIILPDMPAIEGIKFRFIRGEKDANAV